MSELATGSAASTASAAVQGANVIPGQMSDRELAELRKVCAFVKPGGFAVEVGSLYGLSGHAIAGAIPPDATLFCIDPWVREQWIIDLVETKQLNVPIFSKEAFSRFTASRLNIVPLQGYSPDDFGGWRIPVDLVFEDSIHENPVLRRNLRHWIRHLTRGGVLCGHDYCDDWPDVVAEVDALAAEFGASVTVADSFWWFRT